jgi:hypothetical protein
MGCVVPVDGEITPELVAAADEPPPPAAASRLPSMCEVVCDELWSLARGRRPAALAA